MAAGFYTVSFRVIEEQLTLRRRVEECELDGEGESESWLRRKMMLDCTFCTHHHWHYITASPYHHKRLRLTDAVSSTHPRAFHFLVTPG